MEETYPLVPGACLEMEALGVEWGEVLGSPEGKKSLDR